MGVSSDSIQATNATRDVGYTVNEIPLNVREWTCPECGSIHDGDINTTRNVLAAGLLDVSP